MIPVRITPVVDIRLPLTWKAQNEDVRSIVRIAVTAIESGVTVTYL